MRPATYEPEQIIEAGLALQAEGRNITGFALRSRIGGGNPGCLRQIWDEHLASQMHGRVRAGCRAARGSG